MSRMTRAEFEKEVQDFIRCDLSQYSDGDPVFAWANPGEDHDEEDLQGAVTFSLWHRDWALDVDTDADGKPAIVLNYDCDTYRELDEEGLFTSLFDQAVHRLERAESQLEKYEPDWGKPVEKKEPVKVTWPEQPLEYASVAEWQDEARHRFGPDPMCWRFVCPSCGLVASVQDYKDAGASEGMAGFSCIGRCLPDGGKPAFGGAGTGPCNYAGGGLFGLNPVKITTEDGQTDAFAFAESDMGKQEAAGEGC